MHLVLLVALFRARRAVRRAGRPGDDPPARRRWCSRSSSASPLLAVVRVSTDNTLDPHRGRRSLLVVGALAFRALWLWLRPPGARAVHAGEHERATALVHAHGEDSLAYFALRRDKSYVFSPSGRSFLAYRVVGGTRARGRRPDRRRRRARASWSREFGASPARRAGASRSPARRARRSRTTRRSVSSRSTSATRP